MCRRSWTYVCPLGNNRLNAVVSCDQRTQKNDVTKEFSFWKGKGCLLAWLAVGQHTAQAPVFDISRQSSTRRPTTAHLLEIWPCCRSFTGTRRPEGGSPSRRSSQIAARVTFDWGNGSRHGDGIVFHAQVIITKWSFYSSYAETCPVQ